MEESYDYQEKEESNEILIKEQEVENQVFTKNNPIHASFFRCLSKSIVKIIHRGHSTGFLMKLKIEEKFYFFLVTCEHCISDEDINSKIEIILQYFNLDEKLTKKILKLDKDKRFIKSYQNKNNKSNKKKEKDLIDEKDKQHDVTVIQIFKSDKILNTNYYLEPDLSYKEDKEYLQHLKKELAYIGGFPKKDSFDIIDFSLSQGNIFNITKEFIVHNISTSKGSSGSPILNNHKKIIGIHKGGVFVKKINVGTFIGPIIDDLLNGKSKIIYNMNKKNDYFELYKIIKYILLFILFFIDIFMSFDRMKEIKNKDGTIYYGYLKNNLYNKYGTLSKKGKKIYEGNWKDGKYYGNGTLYYDNGKVQYKGEWLYGKKNGYGILNFEDGRKKYEGNWKDEKFYGTGTLYYDNGKFQYKGGWIYGKKNGYGILYFKDGRKKYEGNWKLDKEDGYGTRFYLIEDDDDLKFFNGNYDICDKMNYPYDENLIIEHLETFYKNPGEHICYKGNWTEGKQNGQGTYLYYNGFEKYNGTWVNNTKTGKGELRNKFGRLIYDGYFLENKKNGYGVLYDLVNHGLKYQGYFTDDVYDGHGILFFNKEKYEIDGYFINGILNGSSTIYLNDGYRRGDRLCKGGFINGKLDGRWDFYNGSKNMEIIFDNGKKISNIMIYDLTKRSLNIVKENDFIIQIFGKYSIFKNATIGDYKSLLNIFN